MAYVICNTLMGDLNTSKGPLTIDVPRDREGSFEPEIIQRYQTHFLAQIRGNWPS